MSRTRRTFRKRLQSQSFLEALKEKNKVEVLAKVRATFNQISMWKSKRYGIFLQFSSAERSLPR
jgi:hypothetical protein